MSDERSYTEEEQGKRPDPKYSHVLVMLNLGLPENTWSDAHRHQIITAIEAIFHANDPTGVGPGGAVLQSLYNSLFSSADQIDAFGVHEQRFRRDYPLEPNNSAKPVELVEVTPVAPLDLPFRDALARLLNSASRENFSNTPDFILAQYLSVVLRAFERGVLARDQWYGVTLQPGATYVPSPVDDGDPPLPFDQEPPPQHHNL